MKRIVSLSFGALLFAAPVAAQLPVFMGDPVDPSTGQAFVILPGVASVQPGSDEDFNTGDDVINPAQTGDVDLVVRTGGTFSGGAIPAPAASVAAAPSVVAGGTHSGIGNEVAIQVIVSDGTPTPAAGAPLLGAQHDSRAFLVFAYPDLDGDGVLGPTNADGSADNEIERQEALTIIGRQVGLIESGVGSGNLAVALAAPASAGGLGVVVTGAALMGSTAPKYFDGPWAGTLQPIMPPVSAEDVIGGGNGVRAPDPAEEYLVELELEYEKWFQPAPGHPVLGTPYAIPLDGTSVTVDLLRSESGTATSVTLAPPVVAGSFTADPAKRLLPIVASGGGRELVEAVASLPFADDGPGNTIALRLFASDVLGNAADPAAPLTVVLTAPTGLAIVSPDGNADPQTETIVLATASASNVEIDDAGGAADGPGNARLVASVDGVPAAFVDFLSTTPGCGNGQLDPGEACDDGNTQDGDGCQADCTLSTAHDSVVLAPKPLTIKLRDSASQASKKVRIKVRNADTGESTGHVVRLIAEDGDCPAGTISSGPDFDPATPGNQDSRLVAGGATKGAEIVVTVARADFTSVNASTPTRCRLELRVEADVIGNSDPVPSNDVTPLEINVIDQGDPQIATAHESFVESLKPLALRIAAGQATRSKVVKVAALNGDVVPGAEKPGHLVTATTDDFACPVGVLAAIDFDRSVAGDQEAVLVAGGRKARGSLTIAVDAADFLSAGSKSPARCVATVRVDGPGGDADGSNDTTRLVIDVVDGNDE
jgi:cysteine-rich repeat protein